MFSVIELFFGIGEEAKDTMEKSTWERNYNLREIISNVKVKSLFRSDHWSCAWRPLVSNWRLHSSICGLFAVFATTLISLRGEKE